MSWLCYQPLRYVQKYQFFYLDTKIGVLECVGNFFANVAYFVFLRDVWIRAQRAAAASRRANKSSWLAQFEMLKEPATELSNP
jgi:hypothetical protein